VIKIISRHQRVATYLSSKITSDIPPILKEQGIGLILRMPLKEDKETFVLFYKCINTSVWGTCKYAISRVNKGVFGNPIPP
jgi:hypothetical protein